MLGMVGGLVGIVQVLVGTEEGPLFFSVTMNSFRSFGRLVTCLTPESVLRRMSERERERESNNEFLAILRLGDKKVTLNHLVYVFFLGDDFN